jgi:hypothetical protein
MALGASAQAGVNLANDAKPPGYSKALTVYQRDGKIYAAWAVGSNGSRDAGAFEVGFYVRGQRQLVATFRTGLRRGYRGYGTDAPLNLPDGESVVEMKINDTRWVGEDSFADNNISIRVTVNRGGGAGVPTPLTRAEATYQWPSTFGNSSVSRIIARMTEMHTAQWKPAANFTNWAYTDKNTGKDVYSPSYAKGTTHSGLPYSQCNPVSVAGFLGYLPRMSGTLNWTTSAGVDCSRSIAQAMELPSNHNTTAFDTDKSSYFTSVVAPGTLAKNASKIQPGDAIVSASWGHMVLVIGVPTNGKVEVLEATPDRGRNASGEAQYFSVVKNTRSLSDLDAENCRGIRRNKLQ